MIRMKLGAMNHPQRELKSEIKFVAENFDFLDLTIEPGTVYSEDVNTEQALKLKDKYKLHIIGHTPWNLPIASPYKTVRDAAFKEYEKCLSVFSRLKVNLVNIHPHTAQDISDPKEIIKLNIEP